MKNKSEIILIGGGSHSLVVAETIETAKKLSINGFLDPNKDSPLSSLGYNWLGNDKLLTRLTEKFKNFHISIGQIQSSKTRSAIFKKVKNLGGYLPALISTTSIVSNKAEISEGCLIGVRAIINPFAIIKENTIINTNATIEHGSTIGKNCHIAPSAVVLGDVKIEDGVFVGAGAIIREGVTLKKESFIPAGSVITK